MRKKRMICGKRLNMWNVQGNNEYFVVRELHVVESSP
jgi:hypothetical protein